MPWKPRYPGELPTLGHDVLQWITDNLAAPDRQDYEPLILTREQAEFILRFYQVDPETGRRRIYRRALLSRPKGFGKSPFLSAIAIAEALAPVFPDGWDANGRPAGKPWSEVRTVLVQVAASSEDQTANAWSPLLEMVQEGPLLDAYPFVVPMQTFVSLGKGRIEPVTAAATSREGARPVFAIMDQTESWLPSNGGVRLAAAMRRNLGKTRGASIEAPNAFVPGEKSVAESSAKFWDEIKAGKRKNRGLLYDHREAPAAVDMTDPKSLYDGLAYAYGDSADLPDGCRIHTPPCENRGWVDLHRLVEEVYDPDTDPADARRFYLGQITHARDAWITHPEWAGCFDVTKVIADRDRITLGFDGSRGRSPDRNVVADSTALIGCRVSDGHLFEIKVWEQPRGEIGRGWQPPTVEIDAAVRAAFKRYDVVGFFADPAGWDSYIDKWAGEFSKRLKVKAGGKNPIAWPMHRSLQVVQATRKLHAAIVGGEVSHDGSHILTAHALNARRREGRSGITVSKAHPESEAKIDALVASILAFQARSEAVAAGLNDIRRTSYVPKRLM